ncbi:MAG: methyl-accepting chemotaxis protein [Defluviitaleaceae bacterium]|nr:methyl-accepting chemotaxis protein [Defluviitaleaceae bacterium]
MQNLLRKIKIGPRLYFMFGFIIFALLFIAWGGISSRVELMQQGDYMVGMVEVMMADTTVGATTQAMLLEIHDILGQQNEDMVSSNRMILVYIAVGFAFALVMSIAIVNSITKPLGKLAELSQEAASGKLHSNIDRTKSTNDEISSMGKGLLGLIDTLKDLTDDLAKLNYEFNVLGNTSYRVDSSKYQNSFKQTAEEANNLLDLEVKIVRDVIGVVKEISDGNFDARMDDLPGAMMILPNTLNDVTAKLKGVSGEINHVISKAALGSFERSNVDAFSGDWRKILLSINDLIDAIEAPVQEIEEVLGKVSKGDFSRKITGDYHGDFLKIENSVNSTVDTISSYIKEIGTLLSQIGNMNLRIQIKRDYVGEFAAIKTAINAITHSVSSVVSEINSASGQVAEGAVVIANSTSELMGSFEEQTASTSESADAVKVLTDKTRKNSEDANKAKELSEKVQDAAHLGESHMREMSETMDAIKASSSEIAKVAEIIEGIAFQTNLLALNASVEAARAGEHGKGFAVVADEVRNLAGRSATAAKEASEMIEKSLSRVDDGVAKSAETTQALNTIVEIASSVADVVANISQASHEQVEEISKIQSSMEVISGASNGNAMAVQSSASVSQELSSQADMLASLVGQFKTR